ncbi:hypothetical protein TrVE_jg6345, partial [Triparma verrucosa]
MVAFVVRRCGRKGVGGCLKCFFEVFGEWKWPRPVLLKKIREEPPEGWAKMQVWNPGGNRWDGRHLMPIVTPCYPSMNSSYNVGKGQLRRMEFEIKRGREVLEKIFSRGKKGEDAGWEEFFRETNFFNRFSNFLEVRCCARNGSDFRRWHRWVESKLRILIAGLEMAVEQGVEPHPFAKFFDVQSMGTREKQGEVCGTSFFIGLRSLRANGDIVDLSFCTNEFLYAVSNWEER